MMENMTTRTYFANPQRSQLKHSNKTYSPQSQRSVLKFEFAICIAAIP